MKKDILNLVGVRCIVHCEDLATSIASKRIPKLLFVEKLTNKVYSWVQNSTKRNSQLISLHELMQLETLQIQGDRWLLRRQVIERLVVLMYYILTF